MIARGKFGIEYFPRPDDEESKGAGWLVAAVVLAAVALLVAAGVRRLLSPGEDQPPEPAPALAADGAGKAGKAADADADAANSAKAAAEQPNKPEPIVTEAPPLPPGAERNRSHAATMLLLRLEKANEANDVELAVSTIEQLRALPAGEIADIDDKLARQLGELNVRRLFNGRSRQWVRLVEVRPGDSATRIAIESGSTLASLLKLNELPSADRLRIGQKLHVMDHPKFTLVVHRAAKYADLSLKGKFFKRYDVVAPVGAAEGNYETPAKLRAFLAEKRISLSPEDRAELETLLPAKTPVLVSEL